EWALDLLAVRARKADHARIGIGDPPGYHPGRETVMLAAATDHACGDRCCGVPLEDAGAAVAGVGRLPRLIDDEAVSVLAVRGRIELELAVLGDEHGFAGLGVEAELGRVGLEVVDDRLRRGVAHEPAGGGN